MKTFCTLLTSYLLTFAAISQSCLPEGITFTTQSQIDSFAINYPGCTEIEGDLIFSGESIENLDGLSMLVSVGGGLYIGIHNQVTNEIESCPILNDISGLSHLTSVSESMAILGTQTLKKLVGLENLTSFGGMLYVASNDSLIDLDGLQGLTSVTELHFLENKSLINFHGLENINYIPGNLIIGSVDIFQWPHGNPSLVNMEGLNNLDSVGGDIQIYNNYSLSNLAGFENLSNIGGNLEISGNWNLKDISSLTQLTMIDSSLYIRINDSLGSLIGLQNLQRIGQYLLIEDNHSLMNLDGLENISSLEEIRLWNNDHLTDLKGLAGLTTIHDYLGVRGNEVLENLNGLEDLTDLTGKIIIQDNASLTDLYGIKNIAPASAYNLKITGNENLSTCEAKSICTYLANPTGTVEIHDNAEGCNNADEVLNACQLSVDEVDKRKAISIYPNPASDALFIESDEKIESMRIFDSRGITIEQWNNGTLEHWNSGTLKIPLNGLAPGLYLVRVETGGEMVVRKVVLRQ